MKKTSTLLTMILVSFLAACHHPQDTQGIGGGSGTSGGASPGGTAGTSGSIGGAGTSGTVGSNGAGSDNGTTPDNREISERVEKRPLTKADAKPKPTNPDKAVVH
jgi:hypothetical protein